MLQRNVGGAWRLVYYNMELLVLCSFGAGIIHLSHEAQTEYGVVDLAPEYRERYGLLWSAIEVSIAMGFCISN